MYKHISQMGPLRDKGEVLSAYLSISFTMNSAIFDI